VNDYPCGHPRTPENTKTSSPPSAGGRECHRCRKCHNARSREYDKKRPPRRPLTGRQANAKARLEDYDWLREYGTPFDEIAARFGIKPNSLREFLYRYGRGWGHR
jgi:hypothetical protein